MKPTIRHTGIVVRDLEKCLSFWCDLLNFTLVKKMQESGTHMDAILGLKNARLTTVKLADSEGNVIELLNFDSHPDKVSWKGKTFSTGLTHIALNVNNISKLYQRLSTEGFSCNAPPQISPDGLAKVTYLNGPEGLFIELVEVM